MHPPSPRVTRAGQAGSSATRARSSGGITKPAGRSRTRCGRQQQHPTVDMRIDVRYERPADGIVAASRHSDLVVVGRRGSHGLVHLGSVVRAVVHGSRCPVMVLTPASRERGRKAAVEAETARS